jgi:hypothetical protein
MIGVACQGLFSAQIVFIATHQGIFAEEYVDEDVAIVVCRGVRSRLWRRSASKSDG